MRWPRLALVTLFGAGALPGASSLVGCSASPSRGTEAAPADAGCPRVETSSGPVLSAGGDTACAYLGVPYAAPPVGSLRWRSPRAPVSWTTPRPSKVPSACPQAPAEFATPSTDEDCLYVNVWTPEARLNAGLPVLVYVYGGSFIAGSGNYPLYDGTNLAAAAGSVVVNMNYRVGAFGFLSSPALRAEDADDSSSGNYGIEDQLAALAWVQANVAAFGGDPKNVTLFGESAGGTSVEIHLTSPRSAGLFQRAIVESGAAVFGSFALSQATADAHGAALAQSLGCTDPATLLDCLRGKAAADVLAAATSADPFATLWWPVVDGVVVPADPMQALAAGDVNRVPVIVGNDADEGGLYVLQSPPTDDASYLAFADTILPGQAAAIVAEYPPSSYAGSYFQAAAAASGDSTIVCPTRTVARAFVAAGEPVFRYEFAHALDDSPLPGLGAFHATELVFVFDNDLLGQVSLQPDEEPLQRLVGSYWASMAAKGDPNGDAHFAWPRYDLANEREIVLDLTPSIEAHDHQADCDFWDALDAVARPSP